MRAVQARNATRWPEGERRPGLFPGKLPRGVAPTHDAATLGGQPGAQPHTCDPVFRRSAYARVRSNSLM
ncbi:protein of unknown function [Pararobbsia alpina]